MNLKKNHLDFQYAGAGDGVGNEEGAGQQVRVIVTGIDGERHDLGELPVQLKFRPKHSSVHKDRSLMASTPLLNLLKERILASARPLQQQVLIRF